MHCERRSPTRLKPARDLDAKPEVQNPKSDQAGIQPEAAFGIPADFSLCSLRSLWLNDPVIRNIIFDWSGTLVDDLPAVLKASNFVLAQSGKPAMSLAQFRAEFQLPFTGFYDRHAPEVPMPQLEEWFHAAYRQSQASVTEIPHARAFLEFCRARQFRTFLLSTVHGDHFKTQCRHNGFDAFIDKPYTDVWDKREKIHELLRENQLQPEETLFIGDMEHDIATAKHGGVHSCAVLTGYNTLEQLRAAEPDLIVEHLSELRGLLEKNDFPVRPAAQPAGSRPYRSPRSAR